MLTVLVRLVEEEPEGLVQNHPGRKTQQPLGESKRETERQREKERETDRERERERE